MTEAVNSGYMEKTIVQLKAIDSAAQNAQVNIERQLENKVSKDLEKPASPVKSKREKGASSLEPLPSPFQVV